MIALRESDRAAGLIKKCWDMGSIHAEGPNPLVAVEIERQLDYIRQDDHGCGGRSRCCGQGAGCRANATGSALESADQRAASLADQAGGKRPFAFLAPASGPALRPGARPSVIICPSIARSYCSTFLSRARDKNAFDVLQKLALRFI
jgi:hypothetical protein